MLRDSTVVVVVVVRTRPRGIPLAMIHIRKSIPLVSFSSLIWVWGSAWLPSAAGAPLKNKQDKSYKRET